MRTKHNRFACENRLYRILSPVRSEAFPDEHHSGDAVPELKFTSRIEKNAIRIGCVAGERFAGESHAQWHSAQLCTNFLQPFDVPRRDEQPQQRKLLAQPKKNSDQDFFFTTVRAATEEHEGVRAERLRDGSGYTVALCLNVRIEFDAAGYMDSVSRNTERCPSLDVSPFCYTHQIEDPERWRDKKSKPSITSLRAQRQSRIDQCEGDPARVRCGSEVGPTLRFNKNNPRGTNHRKRTAHDWPVIQRRVHDFDPGRRSFARQREAGRCGCGQHAVQIRFECA